MNGNSNSNHKHDNDTCVRGMTDVQAMASGSSDYDNRKSMNWLDKFAGVNSSGSTKGP